LQAISPLQSRVNSLLQLRENVGPDLVSAPSCEGRGTDQGRALPGLIRTPFSPHFEIRPIYPLWVMVDFPDGDIMAL
jgi:hypothetical protein